MKALPDLKAGTVVAAILRTSPVRGFLTERAARLRDSKVPKPITETESPLATASAMVSSTTSTARPAATLVISVLLATASMSSDLFM